MVIASVCTDTYTSLLQVLMRSMRRNSPSVDYPWHVICDRRLTDCSRHLIRKEWKNVIFQKIDEALYDQYKKSNPRYFSFDAFNIDSDRVVFFDADLLVVSDVSRLFEYDIPVGMAKELKRPCYNAGVMCLNREELGEDTFMRLLGCTLSEGYGTDQRVYNSWFKGKITEIDKCFNVLTNEYQNGQEANIIHYIYKPFIPSGRKRLSAKLVDLWWKYYD